MVVTVSVWKQFRRIGFATSLLFFSSQFLPAQEESTIPNKPPAESHTPDAIAKRSPTDLITVRANFSEQERIIFESLDIISHVEFPGNPLGDVLEFMSSQHQIPIVIDWNEIEAIGLDDSVEVELILGSARMRNVLTLMLAPHGLSYYVADDVLRVTSIEAADAYTETRVYNVRPLQVDDPESLADVLLYTTGDGSWAHTGGSGELSYFNGSFVIKQNQRTHSEIEAVLNQLAQDVAASPESPAWPAKQRPQHSHAKPAKQPKATPSQPGSVKLNPLPVY